MFPGLKDDSKDRYLSFSSKRMKTNDVADSINTHDDDATAPSIRDIPPIQSTDSSSSVSSKLDGLLYFIFRWCTIVLFGETKCMYPRNSSLMHLSPYSLYIGGKVVLGNTNWFDY
jgi:hypothetical protein